MRLFRISNLLALAGAIGFGTLLFWASQTVQQAEDELRALKNASTREAESIRVLAAEWDYLNRPQRLEELAQDYLDMGMPESGQMMDEVESVPEKMMPATPASKPIPVAARPAMLVKPHPKKVRPIAGPEQNRDFDDLLNELSEGERQ